MARGDETLSAAVHRALAGEPPELVQRFLDEKVVLLSASEPRDRSGPTQVRALVLFERPQSRVIQLLLQTARQIEYRPDLEKVETVERFSNGEVDVQEMRIMLVRISYWLRYQWDVSAGRISAWGAASPRARFTNRRRCVPRVHGLDACRDGRRGPPSPRLYGQRSRRRRLCHRLSDLCCDPGSVYASAGTVALVRAGSLSA